MIKFSFNKLYLIYLCFVDVLEHLIQWTIEGLDLECAIKQPEVAYKVRHLKLGIRLTAALTSCDSYTAFRILVCSMTIIYVNCISS